MKFRFFSVVANQNCKQTADFEKTNVCSKVACFCIMIFLEVEIEMAKSNFLCWAVKL